MNEGCGGRSGGSVQLCVEGIFEFAEMVCRGGEFSLCFDIGGRMVWVGDIEEVEGFGFDESRGAVRAGW